MRERRRGWEDEMGCLFAVFAGGFPRLAVLFIWIARPALFSAAFGGFFLWPLLGILFLPFTTLMYVLLYTPGVGLSGFDFVWLVLAFVLDIVGSYTNYWTTRDTAGVSSGPPKA
jgi:hypothetical protein